MGSRYRVAVRQRSDRPALLESVGAPDAPGEGPVGPINVSYNPTDGDVQCDVVKFGEFSDDPIIRPYERTVLGVCASAGPGPVSPIS